MPENFFAKQIEVTTGGDVKAPVSFRIDDCDYQVAEVLEFWKRNAASLVPDPAQTRGSSYTDCAEWLAVVHELDRQAYIRILQDWSQRHRRRRNLWQALKERRLPLEVEP